MAFKTINNSEFQGKKLYIGYAPVKVVSVNPNKEELEKYFGPQQNDPNYIGKVDVNGKDVPQTRIEFILEAQRPGSNDVFYTRLSFFLNRAYANNKEMTKVQVIDNYGRTVWATNQEVENHTIPVFANGMKAQIDEKFRPLLIGEDRIIRFIRALFCLNDPQKWDATQNKFVPRIGNELESCEGILDHTLDFFKGDYTELNDAVKMAENNTVYVLFGVRSNPDGKQYQTVYTNCFVRKNRKKDSISGDFDKALAQFVPANSEFETCELKDFSVKPTNFGELVCNGPAEAEAPGFSPIDDLPVDDEPWKL